jgi:hypothetical protein
MSWATIIITVLILDAFCQWFDTQEDEPPEP